MDPEIAKLPRQDGVKRDWGKPGLTPPSRMFKPKNRSTPSLVEFEKETGVQGMEGAHPGPMAELAESHGRRKEDIGAARAAAIRHARTKHQPIAK